MNNKFKMLYFLLAGAIVLNACKKVLDQEPKATATKDAVFSNEADFNCIPIHFIQ